jgi:hypothetical protein
LIHGIDSDHAETPRRIVAAVLHQATAVKVAQYPHQGSGPSLRPLIREKQEGRIINWKAMAQIMHNAQAWELKRFNNTFISPL